MQALHLDDLAGHVVAWHNRHPLARRITLQHVHSLGYVVLPFVAQAGAAADRTPAPVLQHATAAARSVQKLDSHAQDGATLRERAMARASQSSPEVADAASSPATAPGLSDGHAVAPVLRAGFSENFIRPLRPRAVAAFAVRHAANHAMPGKATPVRMVKPDGDLAPSALLQRWLLTAQIEVDGRRSRVLAGTGAAPALLGKRLWSLPRLALVAALPLAVVLAVTLGLDRAMKPTVSAAVPASAAAAPAPGSSPATTLSPAPAQAAAPDVAASVASHGPAALASASTSAAATAPTSTSTSTSASALGLTQSLPAKPPPVVDVDPSWGRVNLPSIGPVVDERRRAAFAAAQAASANIGSRPTTTAATPESMPANPITTKSTPSSSSAAAAAIQSAGANSDPLLGGPTFAVTTRLIRTRAESEQIAQAMRGLLAGHAPSKMRVETLRSGDDWRVVSWPYGSREQANQASALLAARGMKVQVVDF